MVGGATDDVDKRGGRNSPNVLGIVGLDDSISHDESEKGEAINNVVGEEGKVPSVVRQQCRIEENVLNGKND